MVTPVQQEAERLLTQQAERKGALGVMCAVGTVVTFLTCPLAGLLLGVVGGTAALAGSTDNGYTDELRKAARGEREDLPEPPDDQDGVCCQ